MKLIEFLKEVWKQNKISFLVASLFVVFGCYIIYARLGSHLQYTIPMGVGGTFLLMYFFAFIIGDK